MIEEMNTSEETAKTPEWMLLLENKKKRVSTIYMICCACQPFSLRLIGLFLAPEVVGDVFLRNVS
jgi:hypothetical protein